jgi:6-phosphofructokinase 1
MATTKDGPSRAVTVLASAGIAGALTYSYIKKQRERKEKEIEAAKAKAFYKLASRRSSTFGSQGVIQEEEGTLLTDVRIDKVYLWEVAHLSSNFDSEAPKGMVNHMNGLDYSSTPLPANTPTFLRSVSPQMATEEEKEAESTVKTHYNKLIGTHECILSDLVRKPGSKKQTVAYVRAGPRRELHFNPKYINAAIVTCK